MGDKIKMWLPLFLVACSVVATSAVGAYKIETLKDDVTKRVSKDTYNIQLADVKSSHLELKAVVDKIQTTQQQQTEIKIRQEYMKQQIESSNKKIESLDKKMDNKFDDLKDFIRRNLK